MDDEPPNLGSPRGAACRGHLQLRVWRRVPELSRLALSKTINASMQNCARAIAFTAHVLLSVRETPADLLALARYVARAFYEPLHAVIVEILARDGCVKLDDIVLLCQIEAAQVKAALNHLLSEKLLRSKLCEDATAPAEPAASATPATPVQVPYYFIDYQQARFSHAPS